MNVSGRARLLVLVASIAVISGCGSGGGTAASAAPSVAASPSEASSASPSAAGSASGTPIPTSSSGNLTCVSASAGPEIECPLEAGTYDTVGMKPNLTYTVPTPGWASMNREVAPGNFHLFPPGGSMAGFASGTTDDITIVTAVVPPGLCTGKPATDLDQTYDGMLGFLTKDDRIALSDRRDASVGGLDGTVMDITFVKEDGCPDGSYSDLFVGVDPAHGTFGIVPGMVGMRFFLLHNPSSDLPIAVLIDDAAKGGSDYGDGTAWTDAAQKVIDTITFSP